MKRLLFLGLISPLYAVQTINVPTDYQTLEAALDAADPTGATILLENTGPHKLTRGTYSKPVIIKAATLSHAGRYYGHLVGSFQEGPYALSVEGSTITVKPMSLAIPGKNTLSGTAVEFSEVVPGDKILVYKQSGVTEYEVVHARGSTITISKKVSFEPGDGFTIKPRVSVVAQEEVTFEMCSFKGVSLEGSSSMRTEQCALEECLCNWRFSASQMVEAQVVHLNSVEVTNTYTGKGLTFLGSGLSVLANRYAQTIQSCFIGCDKAIAARMYAHLIVNDSEFFGGNTAVYIDGGSHVALPGCWLRSNSRGVKLSANSSCMTSDMLIMSEVAVGIRALFNSQFHADSLVLHDVDTHAEIDDQTLVELMPPYQQGVTSLQPDGYGAYHSGVSYNYLSSNTYSNNVENYEHKALLSDDTTFLDSIPTEELIKPYRTKKFVMPVQRRALEQKDNAKDTKEKRCSRNCGKAAFSKSFHKKEPCKKKKKYRPNRAHCKKKKTKC